MRRPSRVFAAVLDIEGRCVDGESFEVDLPARASAVDAALARPEIGETLRELAWFAGAGYVTAVHAEPIGSPIDDAVVWRGSDGALDATLLPASRLGGGVVTSHWSELWRYAPVEDTTEAQRPPRDMADIPRDVARIRAEWNRRRRDADLARERRAGRTRDLRKGVGRDGVNNQQPLSYAQAETLLAALERGCSYRQAAAETGISVETCRSYAKAWKADLRVELAENRLSSKVRARIRRLGRTGLPNAEIARRVGVSLHSVRRYRGAPA